MQSLMLPNIFQINTGNLTLSQRTKASEKNIEKRSILTQSIEKSLLHFSTGQNLFKK